MNLRRWLAYMIHPDTPLWRTAEGNCEFQDVVEQSRHLDAAIKEAEHAAYYESEGMDVDRQRRDITRVGREWSRLKQALGVQFDRE